MTIKSGTPTSEQGLEKAAKQFAQKMSNFRVQIMYQASKVNKVSRIQMNPQQSKLSKYKQEMHKRRSLDKNNLLPPGKTLEDIHKLGNTLRSEQTKSMKILTNLSSDKYLFIDTMNSIDSSMIMEEIEDTPLDDKHIGEINRMSDRIDRFFPSNSGSQQKEFEFRNSKKLQPIIKNLTESQF